MTDLEKIWQKHYATVPLQLKKIKQSGTVATAFNANIDAVSKVRGAQIAKLAQILNISVEDAQNGKCQISAPQDVVRGVLKCFISGNAEEWLADSAEIYDWLKQNIGYERLQMGGQGGIVANALAVLGVPRVIAHTAMQPKLQAEQFLNLPNLFALDDMGNLGQARRTVRTEDTALVHWIIEFDKGDTLTLDGKTYTCPKSNRFIASYDSANMALVTNNAFVRHISDNGYDYLVLSGFHGLTAKNGGVERMAAVAKIIKIWKNCFPQGLIHLELASTQDKVIRQAILQHIAPLADSLGLNDREALEVLEVINPAQYDELKAQKLSAVELYEICWQIRQKTQIPRLQMHMFGLYITLQNKDFSVSAPQNLRGMLLASAVAASKANLGKLEKKKDLLAALQSTDTTALYVDELQNLSTYLQAPQLLSEGIIETEDACLIAVPTLIATQPRTLVGMGDTISSVSLIGAR